MLKKAKNYVLLRSLRAYLNTLAYLSEDRAGEMAFEIFSTPRRGRTNGKDEPLLAEAGQEDLFIEGLKIRAYHWPGEGQRILLLHGWESNTLRWKRLIKVLRKQNVDIIAIDAPAHGQSGGQRFTVPLYAKILNQVLHDYRPDTLVGHSAGGMAAVVSISQYGPVSLQKLVLLSTPSELEGLVEIYRRYLQLNQRVIKGLDRTFRERFSRPMYAFSMADFATKLTLPGLIIHDKDDDIAPLSEAEAIHKSWPNSRLEITEGLGHSLRGKEVVKMINDFFFVDPTA